MNAVLKAPATPERTVQLQVNHSRRRGAWTTVVRFDAADDMAVARVQRHAEELGHVDRDVAWRIATADAMPLVLMRLDAGRGWVVAES